MKKFSRYILLAVALIFFIGLAPRFLALDATQKYIAEKLGNNLNSAVTINDIRWNWLPTPHISLTGTTIYNENAQLTLPEIKISARWRMLTTSELLPEKFNLENPQIILKIGAAGKDKPPASYTIPETGIYIKDGTLKVQAEKDGEVRETVLQIGYAEIDLVKTDRLLQIDIAKLVVKDPQFRLSGTIERRLAPADGRSGAAGEIPEPLWTLDLKSRDLDLTGIRKSVLALWSDHEVARTVCGIVQAGRAKTAAYRFSGKLEDFEDLDKMVIEAEPFGSSIHVPEAELNLTEASGPILIRDSVLTGSNLSARLDDSFGTNAKLLLDLSDRTRAFQLDIDIDADLKALPPVLEQLVDHQGFLHELSRFRNVSGRATGNLLLGETLDSIETRVNIGTMKLSAEYEPVPETVFIDKGTLNVSPQEVSWHEVNGHIGKQNIISTGGKVSWDSGATLLQIDYMQGKLDAGSLYSLLERAEVLPAEIKENLAAIDGTVDLTRGWLKGNAGSPETWGYQLAVQSKTLDFASPQLPEQVTVTELSAEISDKQANILQGDFIFLDQPINLKGKLKHHVLEKWHGKIELNGPLQAGLADWIGSKGWFSEKMRPKIPCTLENMNVGFKDGIITVFGKIRQGLTGDRNLPMAAIDFVSTTEQLLINELTFQAPGELGTLTLDLHRRSPRGFNLTWQGFARADTIDSLFHHSSFASGTFSGAFFEVSYAADQPEETRFKGILKAENLLLKNNGSNEKPVIFQDVLLNGIGKQLRIASLMIDVGSEKLQGSGHISVQQQGLQLDIDLSSSYISKSSIDNLVRSMQQAQHAFLLEDTDQNEKPLIPADWDITGRIGFDLVSFSIERSATKFYSKGPAADYTLYDVQGEMQLASDTLSRTEIFSSRLCDLDFRSTWHSDDALGQQLTLGTSSQTPLLLENVLPCLGVDQDLLEGEFTLKANLRKESGEWFSGNIHLNSTRGRILRFQLLSRIFKVVNITDLFMTDTGTTGKKGFPFSRLDIDAHINKNYLVFDRAILHGEGLNLFLQGDIHLTDYDADLTLLVAPFKTFDTLVSKVPLIGQPIMSGFDSLVAIPVAIKGPLPDPLITPLQLEAVSGALFNIVKETFKLPYNILKPNEIQKK